MPNNINSRLYARSFTSRGASTAAPSSGPCAKTADPCERPCSDCGSLRCLCRPRFFAGQLLTEQDLNRLDNYIREKNRLHALQLHGSGVVNGLAVRCDQCGTGTVVVGKGYAISPCGDDIIVCEDTLVDICALIKKCQPVDTSCLPMTGGTGANGNDKSCEDLVEEWVLAIRYAEAPSRGITALRMGPTCTCGATKTSNGGCGCGGAGKSSSSGSCACGGTTTTTAKPRTAPPECEPTVICEGFSFDVFRAPKVTETKDRRKLLTLGGPLFERVMCCIQPLIDEIPTPPEDQGSERRVQWNLWCCQAKAAILGYLASHPGTYCSLSATLQQLACPDPKLDGPVFQEAMQAALQVFAQVLIEIMLDCVCTALLPPAPDGSTDDRLPLAVVKVRKRDCVVMEICNWTPLRRFVMTFPSISYWLSWLPLGAMLRELIHRICCRPFVARTIPSPNVDTTHDTQPHGVVFRVRSPEGPAVAGGGNTVGGTDTGAIDAASLRLNPTLSKESLAHSRTFASLVASAMKRGTTPLDPGMVAAGLLGVEGEEGGMTEEERANPLHFLGMNSLLRPILASFGGEKAVSGGGLGGMARAARPEAPSGAPSAVSTEEFEALKKRLAELERRVGGGNG
jgi:hypothetical protein